MLFFFESTWPILSILLLGLAMIAYSLEKKMIMTILILVAVVVLIAGAFCFKDY